jgi:hypothetical protein
LHVFCTFFLLALPCHAQPTKTHEIPFHDVHGRIVLDVTLDHKPAALLLDTGASMSFSLVHPGRPLYMFFDHGEPRFETGEADERSPTIATPDVRVQGFVGTDILKRFRAIHIDYKAHTVTLEN